MDAMEWLSRIDPNVVLTLLVASIVVVKLWPLFSKVVRVVNIILGLEERLKQIDEKLAKVEKETTTNGGGSLKDLAQSVAREKQARRVEDERRDERVQRLEVAVFHNGPTA